MSSFCEYYVVTFTFYFGLVNFMTQDEGSGSVHNFYYNFRFKAMSGTVIGILYHQAHDIVE